jgi:hypothetical protein
LPRLVKNLRVVADRPLSDHWKGLKQPAGPGSS